MPTPDVAEAVTITFAAQAAPAPLGGDERIAASRSQVTAVAALANGGFIFVLDLKVVVVSATGEVVSEFNSAWNASITPRAGGGFVLLTDNDVGYLLDENGETTSSFVTQGDNGQVAALQDGGWVIVSTAGISRYDADAVLLSHNAIGGQDHGRDVAVLADGSYVVIYLNSVARPGFYWFDAEGVLITNQNIPPFFDPTANGSHNAIAALASGGWVVATHNGEGASGPLTFVIYDAAGQSSSPVLVFSEGFSNWEHGSGVEVATLPDGGFLLTWNIYAADGQASGVYARRFDALGNSVGDTFRVAEVSAGNETTNAQHGGSSLAVLSDGSLVITFTSDDTTGAYGTFYRLFDLTQAFEGYVGGSDIPLPITLNKDDPADTIELIRLSGVPEGVLLSAGVLQADGSWILTEAQIAGLTLDPSSGWAGQFVLTIEVTTRDGADTLVSTATQAVRIFGDTSIANMAPEAGAFGFSVPAGDDLAFDPRSFVQDDDADVLTVTHIDGQAVSSGDTIPVDGVGEVTLNPDGTISVVPEKAPTNHHIAGPRTFTFTVSDGQTSSVQTVTFTVTGTAGTDPFLGLATNDVIEGLGGDDYLFGGDGDDRLEGGEGSDSLGGGDGDDILAGGAGGDLMFGGHGDDTYFVTEVSDTVQELDGEGTDLVKASISYTLGDYLESLTLLFGQPLGGTGNGLGNVITGNSGANLLLGMAGNDTLIGGGGNDSLYGGGDHDTLEGGAGADDLHGEAGSDTLRGGAGVDRLDGGSDGDRMEGGDSADVYVVDDGGDIVVETATGGLDTVESSIDYELGDHLENLTLLGAMGLFGLGNGAKNVIIGNAGDNVLNGMAGDDTVSGGGGRDTISGDVGADSLNGDDGSDLLFGDDGNDRLYGGDGDDDLLGGQGADLLEGQVGSDVLSGGVGNDKLYGGGDDDVLYGDDGNDLMDGGVGADTLYGGAGNDTYYVDDSIFDGSGDLVFEAAGEGTDTVVTSVVIDLWANVENVTFVDGAVGGSGNGLANIMTGNSTDNVLYGLGGADRLIGAEGIDQLYGMDGADILNGGDHPDVLIGGAGGDQLTGGSGVDTFHFGQDDIRLTGAGLKPDKDKILDWSFDVIDLAWVDGDPGTALTFVGAFTKTPGQIVLTYAASSNTTTVSIDVDGDGKADLLIAITGDLTSTTGNLYTGWADGDGGWVL